MGALRKLRRKAEAERDYDVVPLRPRGTPPIEQKMSDVIVEFADPLLKDAPDDKSFKGAVGFAVTCWDVALLPEEEQEKSLCGVVRDLARDAGGDPGVAAYLEAMARLLVARKKLLFPDDKRMILDYEFVGEGDSLELFVTFTTEAPPSHPAHMPDGPRPAPTG